MAFKRRLTAPSTTDKNWIHTSKGGKNSCILVSGNSVLPNCFVGETKFITRDGIKTLKECEGKDIQVLSEGGIFRPATVKNFGKQPIYKLTFNNGSEYLVTANHRWVVDTKSQWATAAGELKKTTKRKIKTTLDLKKSDLIPYEVAQDERKIDREGIQHGFIFGDGSYYNDKKQSAANLCGLKKEYMAEYFIDSVHSCEWANGTVQCYPYPRRYKELPELDETDAYLRGFITGYLASDGCVGKDGSVRLDSAVYKNLEKVKDICAVIGIRTSEIKTQWRKGYNEFDSELHHIYLLRADIMPEMLLNPNHRINFENNPVKSIEYTRVKSIEELNEEREVYCVQEPETHTMVLADNILTGQCVGYAWGRFMEILGSTPKLSRGNAEDWWNYKDGYKRGQTPKLGAVICYRKGKTGYGGDGAGHVAIVEQINSDGSIVISESGYKSFRFRTMTLKKPYKYFTGYTLQGFIYNPAVKDSTTTTTTTNTGGKCKVELNQLKRNSTGEQVKTLQRLLYCMYGCPSDLKIDGQFGPIVDKYVKKFQKDNKLTQDGIVGTNTWNKLLK